MVLMTIIWAAICAPSLARDEQTQAALVLARKGQWSKAEQIIASQNDPFARALFQWISLTETTKRNDFADYTRFIRAYPDWPGQRQLRREAEQKMPDNLPAADIVTWFMDFRPQRVRAMERYLDALIEIGRKDKSTRIVREWWATANLTREEQKRFFAKYGAMLDRNAHILRLDDLLAGGQYSNARAIGQVLGNDYQKLIEARIALREGQAGVNALINQVPPRLRDDPGLMFERLQWRRKKDLDYRAMEILHAAPPAERLKNPADWWRERHIIIRRLLEDKRYESAYLLAKDHRQKTGLPFAQAEWLSGWISLRFLDQPQAAFKHFHTLYRGVSSPISKSRGAYWSGRAAEASGKKDIAMQWYHVASQYQVSFYGQLAAQALSEEQKLPGMAALPALTQEQRNAFSARDLPRAAGLLHRSGWYQQSAQFFTMITDQADTPEDFRLASEFAVELGRLQDSLRIAKKAANKGVFLTAQSFPLMTDKLSSQDVEWALVHSLIRQESAFDVRAVSSAGARGYMQLMPATAQETARKLGISHRTEWLTGRPSHNIRLGTEYMRRMLERYDGSYIMAIAAYNAGPGRVDQWIETYGDPRTGEIDPIDWIELIPIYETRNYVQRVMEGTIVYRQRLQGIQKPRTHLASTVPHTRL